LKMPDKRPGGGGMGTHGIDWDITKENKQPKTDENQLLPVYNS
jgi:hypothetical protein